MYRSAILLCAGARRIVKGQPWPSISLRRSCSLSFEFWARAVVAKHARNIAAAATTASLLGLKDLPGALSMLFKCFIVGPPVPSGRYYLGALLIGLPGKDLKVSFPNYAWMTVEGCLDQIDKSLSQAAGSICASPCLALIVR